jgi:hypothetical protein
VHPAPKEFELPHYLIRGLRPKLERDPTAHLLTELGVGYRLAIAAGAARQRERLGQGEMRLPL